MTVTQLESLSHKHPIILYDGVCVLCNNFVQFVHNNDKQNTFRFATLQDESGQLLKAQLNISLDKQDETVILMHQAKTMTHSDVSLEVFKLLGWPYKGLFMFSIIPKVIRDAVYHFIAKNRYRWFGQSEECMVPQGTLKEKLLD